MMKNKSVILTFAALITLLLVLVVRHDYILYRLLPRYRSSYASLGSVNILGLMSTHLAASRTGVRLAVQDVGYDKGMHTMFKVNGILYHAVDRAYAAKLLRDVLSEESLSYGRRTHALHLLWKLSHDSEALVKLYELTKDPVPENQASTPAWFARRDMIEDLLYAGLEEGATVSKPLVLTAEEIRSLVSQNKPELDNPHQPQPIQGQPQDREAGQREGQGE